ncbi:MAG TPA: hypothetical protein PKE45_09615 [Caldilineaceae bacterium]|nr:hypothetical protein [Caldilineaceae bacterium]
MSGRLTILYFALVWLLTACLPAGNSPAATAAPSATPEPAPPEQVLSFVAATYRDETAGFELSYPETWTLDDVDPAVKGAGRGYYAQLTSWPHAPGELPEVNPPGSSRLDIVVQQWDPKNDLPAFIDVRKIAWEASGFTLVAETEHSLPDGRAAAQFIVQTAEGEQVYFLFSANEEIYVIVSGTGDLALLEEIGQSLRWLDGQ